MSNNTNHNPAIWRPLTDLPEGAETWVYPDHNRLVSKWKRLKAQLSGENTDRTLLDIWYEERQREFAIHTGQIEGLYTLKPGITAHLITEGFKNVTSAHTHENVKTATLKGLLSDQESALEMVFDNIKYEQPLTHNTIFNWHKHITHHQESLKGLLPHEGKLKIVEMPFTLKGQYKQTPNSLVRGNQTVFEFCPPEHVYDEMERLFSLYSDIQKQNIPTHTEAAWLHHRFVRTHPFQDGNGRVSRLLMAYVYLRRGEPSPIITTEGKSNYIQALRQADRGNLKFFSDHIGLLSTLQLRSIIQTSEDVLNKYNEYHHANGGTTENGKYYPPDKDESDYDMGI